MNIIQLIKELQKIQYEHGDIKVVVSEIVAIGETRDTVLTAVECDDRYEEDVRCILFTEK